MYCAVITFHQALFIMTRGTVICFKVLIPKTVRTQTLLLCRMLWENSCYCIDCLIQLTIFVDVEDFVLLLLRYCDILLLLSQSCKFDRSLQLWKLSMLIGKIVKMKKLKYLNLMWTGLESLQLWKHGDGKIFHILAYGSTKMDMLIKMWLHKVFICSKITYNAENFLFKLKLLYFYLKFYQSDPFRIKFYQ